MKLLHKLRVKFDDVMNMGKTTHDFGSGCVNFLAIGRYILV